MESWGRLRCLSLANSSNPTISLGTRRSLHHRKKDLNRPPPQPLLKSAREVNRRLDERRQRRVNSFAVQLSQSPVAEARITPLTPETRQLQNQYSRTNVKQSTPMTSHVEIATTPSADTPHTCIFLRNDKTNYLFGRIGEGTQRAFATRKLSIGNTSNIFLSGHVHWTQTGGLIGYVLTAAAALSAVRDSELDLNEHYISRGMEPRPLTPLTAFRIHGGDNIGHILAASRRFVFRQPLILKIYEHQHDVRDPVSTNIEPDFEDDGIKVWKVPVDGAQPTSPLKRSRESSKEPGDLEQSSPVAFKEGRVPYDPTFAQLIAEKVIFNGALDQSALLLKTTCSELEPGDTAFVKRGSYFEKYIPSETAGPDEQDMPVWVYPETKKWKDKEKEGNPPHQSLDHVTLPKTNYSHTSMSYIVKLHERRGKFNVAAANSLGVEKSDFKRLIKGETVQGKDGKSVTREMVVGDSTPGRGFVVADIPSREYLDAFMQRPEWKDTALLANVIQFYWILGTGLSADPQIQKFIEDRPQFGHIICAPETTPNMITHPGVAELQMKLHRVDPDRFAIMDFNNKTLAEAPSNPSVTYGRTGHNISLMPRQAVNERLIAPFFDMAEASNSVSPAVLELAEQGRVKATDPAFLAQIEEIEKDIPNRDTEIVCLGTGSSCPSKYRNVCATLIRVPGVGSYLLDSGEGTYGQLSRHFGTQKTRDVLRELKCIVISHLHADHHLGTVSVIKAWYDQTLRDGSNANLAISCNVDYMRFLEEVSQVEDFGFHRLYFPSCTNDPSATDVLRATKEHFKGNDCGLVAIQRILVNHCKRSMATELELTSGLRIAWSGDCRPSHAFAQACKGAHLLIHECTFGDDMKHHAIAKKHSTISEAIGVAKEMNARRTILTHFSQRYVKGRALSSNLESESQDQVVLMALDLMSIKLGDFHKAACYAPAIGQLLEDAGDGKGGRQKKKT